MHWALVMPGGLVMVRGILDKVLETEEPNTFLEKQCREGKRGN